MRKTRRRKRKAEQKIRISPNRKNVRNLKISLKRLLRVPAVKPDNDRGSLVESRSTESTRRAGRKTHFKASPSCRALKHTLRCSEKLRETSHTTQARAQARSKLSFRGTSSVAIQVYNRSSVAERDSSSSSLASAAVAAAAAAVAIHFS